MRIKLLSNEDRFDGLSSVTYLRHASFSIFSREVALPEGGNCNKALTNLTISIVSESVLPRANLRVFINRLTCADSYVYVYAI